jgi:hypothetical protein
MGHPSCTSPISAARARGAIQTRDMRNEARHEHDVERPFANDLIDSEQRLGLRAPA